MGMDVVGQNPSSPVGEYFRNNVWWWRPLWDYCCEVAPDLVGEVNGHYNDGDGLDELGSIQLASVLLLELESGRTKQYQQEREAFLALIPDEQCDICSGTGQRPDGYFGVEWKQDGCNKCHGKGSVRPWATEYPFSEENVLEFAEFLQYCGGFAIY